MPTSFPVTAVTEQVKMQQTALLQSEPEYSLDTEDSLGLQQQLAAAEARSLELETQRRNLNGNLIFMDMGRLLSM